jgi:hypothetical protein
MGDGLKEKEDVRDNINDTKKGWVFADFKNMVLE